MWSIAGCIDRAQLYDIDSIARESTKFSRVIDQSLKIYGFMLLIADTLKHDKGFRATTRGSIELRKVYANGIWRVSQSCGRRLTPR